MNEHLTKPIRRAVLEAALARFLRPDGAAGGALSAATPAKPATVGGGVLDSQTWADLEADMSWASVEKLARSFIAVQARELAAMRADLANADRADLRRRAHSLKGAAKLLGAMDLGEAASALELTAETVGSGGGEEAVSALSAMFQDAVRAIEDRVSRGATAA